MGFRIEWDDRAFKDLEKRATSAARDEVARRGTRALAGLRCPEHGKRIRFVKASSATKTDLGQIEACCDKAAKLGEQALSRALK